MSQLIRKLSICCNLYFYCRYLSWFLSVSLWYLSLLKFTSSHIMSFLPFFPSTWTTKNKKIVLLFHLTTSLTHSPTMLAKQSLVSFLFAIVRTASFPIHSVIFDNSISLFSPPLSNFQSFFYSFILSLARFVVPFKNSFTVQL